MHDLVLLDLNTHNHADSRLHKQEAERLIAPRPADPQHGGGIFSAQSAPCCSLMLVLTLLRSADTSRPRLFTCRRCGSCQQPAQRSAA